MIAVGEYTISDIYDGDGYRLSSLPSSIVLSNDGEYNPSEITLTSKYKQGSNDYEEYSGRFKIETSGDNEEWTTQYTSSSDEASKVYSLPSPISNSTPYTFRGTADSNSVGNREYNELVGLSVGWNQLLDGKTDSRWYATDATKVHTDDIITMTATAQNGQINCRGRVTGQHKYLAIVNIKTTTATTDIGVAWYSAVLSTRCRATTEWQTIYSISMISNSSTSYQIRVMDKRTSNWDAIQVKNDIMLIDLTLCFGTQIADYIYSLEQSTAGNGVAWIRKYFPKILNYHPHDVGSIQSVSGLSAHVTRGFNQWDEEWEIGSLTQDGNDYASITRFRSKNPIPVLPNTTYYIKAPNFCDIHFYEEDGTHIAPYIQKQNATFVTPSNVSYIKFCNASGTIYNHDICINLSSDKDGIYESYTEHHYLLDSSITLRGRLRLDANNVPYADGDVYHADGTVTRRFVTKVYNGATSEGWGTSGTGDNLYFGINVGDFGSVVDASVVCDKYIQTNISTSTTAVGINVINSNSYNKARVAIRPSNVNGMSVTAFRELLAANPVTVVYEVVMPTTEQAQPYQSPQICDGSGTEEYVSTSLVSVGHNTKYISDIKTIRASLYKAGGTTSLLDQITIPVLDGVIEKVFLVKTVPEYTISTSMTSLPSSPVWSEQKPTIDAEHYLWTRQRSDFSNGTSTYSNAVCDVVITGILTDVDSVNASITNKVWQSDINTSINTYDGNTVSSIRDRVTQTEQDISGITTRVSDVESETGDLGTRMTTAESSITQNATNIESKVSKDGVISSINQSAESITINANKVNIEGATLFTSGRLSTTSMNNAYDAKGSAAAVQTNLDNLEIGGRNLLKWTGNFEKAMTVWTRWNGVGTLTRTTDGIKYTFGSSNSGIVVPLTYDNAVEGTEELTLSFQYRTNLTNWSSLYLLCTPSPNVNTNPFSSMTVSETNWVKFSKTFSFPTHSTRTATSLLIGYASNTSFWIEIKEGSLKLEKGNKATAWTPAPEDVEASIEDYASSITSQIDGMAEIHYGTVAPTTSNAPYTSWTTTEERDKHIDDLYYNTATGYCYRFGKSGSTYSWTRIKDSDITSAATAASDANTLAGSKRRVFVSQPTPPYEVGDLWVQGANGDIMRCDTARASGSYTASDWVKASKYTDDTAVNNLEIGGRNLLLSSADMSGNKHTASPAPEFIDDYVKITTTAKGWYDFMLSTKCRSLDLISAAQSLALSLDVKMENAGDGALYVEIITVSNDNLGARVRTASNTIHISSNFPTEWTRVSGIASTDRSTWMEHNENTEIGITAHLYWYNTGTLYIRKPKLEIGNKPTDWTPAPEDVDVSIGEAIDNIQVGGRNLLKDSANLVANWVLDNSTRSNGIVTCTPTADGYARMYQMPANGYWEIWQDGVEYSVSVDARAVSDTSEFYFAPRASSSGTVHSVDAEWKRYSISFTGVSSTASMSFIVSGGKAAVQFRRPKLEYGNKPTDWTRAPEDQIASAVSCYYRKSTSAAPSAPSSAVGTANNTDNTWTYVMPLPKKNYYFFTCEEYITVGGTKSYSAVRALDGQTYVSKWVSNTDATYIDGGNIYAHSITSSQLATDAIVSNNYMAGPASSPYSSFGTFLDLSNGNLYTPNFGVDNVNGSAYINGNIIATSGKIGDDTGNYWEIGNTVDSQGDDSASIIGHGTAFIQDGDWQIHNGESNHSNGSVSTQWYITPLNQGKQLTHPFYNNVYYDFGMSSPILNPSDVRYDATASPNFLYIRKHASTIPIYETDWQYLFKVDKDGNAYVNNLYVNGTAIATMIEDGVDGGAYLPTSGGTINGNLTVTGTLNATASKANQLNHAISVNGKAFDGSSDVTVGTLGIAYGGTGQTTAANAINYLLQNGCTAGTSVPTDNDTYISSYADGKNGQSGSPGTNTFHRRPLSALWTYIKGKITADHDNLDGVYVKKTGDVMTGSLTVENGIMSDIANFGSIVVSGSGRFGNGLYGDLIGNADTATKAAKVADSNNGTETTFAYSKAALTTTNDIAVWNGYELRKITSSNLKTVLGLSNAVSSTGATFTGEVINQSGGIWVQGGSASGNNTNRIVLDYGSPQEMKYGSAKRGTRIYSNGIAFGDPYNGSTNNDAGWVRMVEETANSGYLEIATGDDGTEPIYVRQYNTSNSIVREITLLNASGNTTFPGTVTASSFSGNASSASAFNSNRTIQLTGDVTGSASGTGSSGWSITTTVADNSHNHMPQNIVQENSAQSGNLDPLTQAMIGSASSNKSFGLPANAITVEYSTNGGSTWTDYGATDDQKRSLFNETRLFEAVIGKSTSKETNTVNNQLRITIEPKDRYVSFNGVYIWFNTQGNTCTIDLERSTIGAKDTFTTVFTGQPISGWSGNNIRYFSYGSFGGGDTQTSNNYKYRLTFKQTAVNTNYASARVYDVRFLGANVWNAGTAGTASHHMLSGNRLYKWDNDYNVTFPAGITATSFTGNASSASKLNTAGTVRTNLASTSAATYTNGGNITPGVTGTLPIANGGTGATTAQDALWNLARSADPGDLNTARRLGIFKIANTTTNTPSSGMWGAALNVTDDFAIGNNDASGSTYQLVFQSSSSNLWLRTKTNNGNWGAYAKFYSTANKPSASDVGLGNVTNNKQVKGLSSGTTSGHLVTWGSDGYTVADSGIALAPSGNTRGIVSSVASNSSGQLVLTYADGTTSAGIDVEFVATQTSSVQKAEALNVNGTAVGSSTVPVFFNNQGKPQTASTYAGGTAVTLNGSSKGASTASFYAPTGAGTSGQVLTSSGGTPGWTNQSSLSVGSAAKASITTVENSVAKYSDTAGTFTDSYITIDSSGNLIIGDNDHPGNIKIGAKNDNYGLMPNVNNYNQIGASGLSWYRAYITNYYGTNSNVTNWASDKNIGTPASSSAAATLGKVNFYNTCAAGGTQTKTALQANSSTASNITLTLPSSTGTLALTSSSITGNAATATKFSSNRTISLNGDVTGSASSNGESGWSITTAVADNSHNHSMNTIVPRMSKTYTGVIATANNQADGNLYFIKIVPEAYGKKWTIHYRVYAEIAGVSDANGNGKEFSDVYISGARDNYITYKTWNDIAHTSYRPYYYHALYRARESVIAQGHGLGLAFRSTYNPTTTANSRTVTFEIMDYEGCTVSFLDTPVKYTGWSSYTSSNFLGITEFDGVTQGNSMSGDRNDPSYQQREYYASRTAYTFLGRYMLVLSRSDGTIIAVNTTDNNITTSKTYDTSTEFDPFGAIFYNWTGSTTAANGTIGNDRLYNQCMMDLRYSFNIGDGSTTSTITARKPFYLVATPQANGMAKIHSSGFTQTLPTSDNGLIYIYLGTIYEDTYPYRLNLALHHPVYWYKNGALRQFTGVEMGTTFTGAVNFANNTLNSIGDDAYLGDQNVAGCVVIKGRNGSSGIQFNPYSGSTSQKIFIDGAGNMTITGNIVSDATGTLGSTAKPFHQLVLGGTTNATVDATTTNPRITFQENVGTQPVHLIYSDYDSYRSPAGLKITGDSGASSSPAWLEVEGTVYAPTFSGNATSATKATQDGSGNTITSYYCTLSTAQTISGVKTFSTMPLSSAGICVNSGGSGTAGGVSFWSDKNVKQYGIALRTTADSGKHGYVQGDYATYSYMYAASAGSQLTRGWVFKDSVRNQGVASISGAGHAVFDGSVTIGGNTTNTSGCRQEYNVTLNCLNFVFN